MNKRFIFKMPKITVKQITLAGMFLSIITVFKLLDIAMPKINGVAVWEIYFSVGAIMTLILPWSISLLIFIAAPLLWLAIGQTMINGPWSIILDYFIPMIALIVIKFSFNRWVSPLFVILAGVIKFFSQSLSGKLFWETDWWPSMVYNFPFTAITTSISIVLVFVFYNKIKAIGQVSSAKGVRYYLMNMTNRYVTDFKVLRRGYLNKTALFELDNKKWIIKISNSKAITLKNEYEVSKVFYPESLLSEDHKALIRPYISGETPKKLNEAQKQDLVRKIDKFHSSKINLKIHDWAEYDKYKWFVKREYFDRFKELVEKYKSDQIMPCHHDLNLQNIVVRNEREVDLLDFEWARLNNPVFDYASLYMYDGILLNEECVNKQEFKDYCYMLAVYGYLWTFSIPLSLKARQFRKFFRNKLNDMK